MTFCINGLRLDLAEHRRAPVPALEKGQPLHSVQHRLFFPFLIQQGTGPLEGEGGTFQQLVSCMHTSKMTGGLCDIKHAGMFPNVWQGEPE